MPSINRLISTLSLAAAVSAGSIVTPVSRGAIVPPALRGAWDPAGKLVVADTPKTDFDGITNTASSVNQKSGATGAPLQIADVSVAATDGEVFTTGKTVTFVRELPAERREQSSRRSSGYTQVFSGSEDADAAVEGTAYLTYTILPNSTYNVDACLDFCSSTPDCVFVNLYYELNNPELDALGSNLKCVAYADVHTEEEKTNTGTLATRSLSGSVIQNSSGWSLLNPSNPATPSAYELVFGPTSGANNAPGYMGFSLLTLYSPSACAALCNARAADPVGGSCQYFNIWRATFLGIPLTYVCSMYYIPTDASTATTTSSNGLQVTQSRGYKRKNFAIDGGFEGYAACSTFCYTESYANWIGTSSPGGTADATIFFFAPYARTGHSVGLLGSANNDDALSGTLTAAAPLLTTAGKKYKIGFFHASSFSGPALAGPAFVNVKWNGVTVKTINPGYSNYTYFEVKVTGTGHDTLAFHGGIAPAWSFIDDISVYQL